MTIEQMEKIYKDISAFKDAMRKHAVDSSCEKHDFYYEYRAHADNICEAMGTLSANIAIQKAQEKVYG